MFDTPHSMELIKPERIVARSTTFSKFEDVAEIRKQLFQLFVFDWKAASLAALDSLFFVDPSSDLDCRRRLSMGGVSFSLSTAA